MNTPDADCHFGTTRAITSRALRHCDSLMVIPSVLGIFDGYWATFVSEHRAALK
jgi:hypothetical protein